MLRRGGRGARTSERTGTPADLLVVGLGNPGDEYARTKHNVGAEVVELLAARHGARLKKGKERALVDQVTAGGKRLALAIPLTYMNDSGAAVRALVRRYGVEPEQLVVVHDELDLPVGGLKLKEGGGLAGHNGLKSLKRELGGAEFWRVRVGVGRPDTTDPDIVAGHVLSGWRQPKGEVAALIAEAADEAERLVLAG